MASKEVKDACGKSQYALDGVPIGLEGSVYERGAWGGGGANWFACKRTHIAKAIVNEIL